MDNFAYNLDRFLKSRLKLTDISFESSEHEFDIFDPHFSSASEKSEIEDSSFTESDNRDSSDNQIIVS